MKATAIKFHGKKQMNLEFICNEILVRMTKAGFKTECYPTGETAIKIGLRMSSFRIDVEKLGHNARTDRWCKSPKGYKRTDVPTWDQRVDFNNIVNDVFDKYKIEAKIVSGNYTIRSRSTGRVNSWPTGGDRGSYGYSGDASCDIMPEAEMRKFKDSDRLEAEAREKSRQARATQREMNRQREEQRPHLSLVGAQ